MWNTLSSTRVNTPGEFAGDLFLYGVEARKAPHPKGSRQRRTPQRALGTTSKVHAPQASLCAWRVRPWSVTLPGESCALPRSLRSR